MKKFIILLLVILASGCSRDLNLSEVIVGDWYLDKYEVYLNGNPSKNALSLDDHIVFFSNGICRWNNQSSIKYTLSGNTIIIYGENTTREYKVTYFTSDFLVWYFYAGKYKFVYYLQKC